MKQRLQGMIFGCILTVLILGTATALAAQTRTIEVTYGVSVVVDGVRQNFAHDMQPFVSGGRTFLPVRGIADTFGVDVNWDASTRTVNLWSSTPVAQLPTPTPAPAPTPTPEPTYFWLDHMPHLNYQSGGYFQTFFSTWRQGSQSTDGTVFDRGLRFEIRSSGGFAAQTAWQSVDIALNANYNTLRGTLVSAAERDIGPTQVRFYGDGRLLYTSPIISGGTIPIPFNVDISNVLLLQIHVEGRHSIGIVDARVERNF